MIRETILAIIIAFAVSALLCPVIIPFLHKLKFGQQAPHEQASARIAPDILEDCGFDDKETDVIVTAISRHRDPEAAKEKNLNGVLYRADKASRACFACDAEKDCNWKDGKKNLTIRY